MGYIAHDAVIVATETYREGGLPDIEAFRESLPSAFRPLVIGPVVAAANGTVFYAFLPDGSKEGWGTSDEGDEYRARFRELFRFVFDDESSPDEVVSVRFGGDFSCEAPARASVDWPPYAAGYCDEVSA